MTEGFDPSNAPTARGRRDPRIEAAMLEDDDPMAGAGEPADTEFFGLAPGDTVMAKVTFSANTDVGEAWYTYGTQTRVLENESEEDTFNRVAEVVNTRVLSLADDLVTRMSEALEARQQEERERARTNRIVPRT